MNTKQTNALVRTLATMVISGGVTLASLTASGCDQFMTERVDVLISGYAADADYQLSDVQNSELASKIAFNHNETFLVLAF